MKKLNRILFSLIVPVVAPQCRVNAASDMCSAECDAPDEKTLGAVFALARRHDLGHLLASSVRNAKCRMQNAELNAECEIRNSELFAELEKAEMTAVWRVKNIVNEQGRVRKCFEEAEIPFILLKGSVIRDYYPEAWMRTSSDIDILVPEDRLSDAVKCMKEKLDCSINAVEPYDASLFARSGVHFDVHALMEGDKEDKSLLTRVWLEAESRGGYERFMTPEHFYFYHVAHMAKHMKNGGCGIRPFIDLYLIREHLSLDATKTSDLLSEFGLTRFESAAVRLSEYWMCGGSADGLEAMEEYVLTGGVYGSRDQYVAVNRRGKKGKLHYLMGRIFMPYEELKKRHKVLERHRWLTPVFEVWRWLGLIVPSRLKRTKNELESTIRLDDDKASGVIALMESLGL